MTMRLLHLTDFHFWQVVTNPLRLMNKRALGNVNVFLRRRHEFLTHQADAFAEHIAGLGIHDVFLGGDFTSTALTGEFRAALRWVDDLESRGLRLHVVPGNHDVYTFGSHRKQRFEEIFAGHLPVEGYPSLHHIDGVPFVLAPTVCPNLISSRGQITRGEIDHTCALVRDCPEDLVLVGAHYPVLEETPWFTTAKSRRLRRADAFRRALANTGKRVLYLCGHAHRFGYIQDATYPNLTHLCTGALFLHKHTAPERGTFTELHIEDGEPRVYLHRLLDRWQREEIAVRSYTL